MNFAEYQARAMETAIYPKDAKVIYPALGLTGEIGEVAEKTIGINCPSTQRNILGLATHGGQIANQVKKIMRDDSGNITSERRAAIASELGDVCWYLAALAHDLDLSLGEIAQENIDKLTQRRENGTIRGDNR